jgi:hypothetical protein
MLVSTGSTMMLRTHMSGMRLQGKLWREARDLLQVLQLVVCCRWWTHTVRSGGSMPAPRTGCSQQWALRHLIEGEPPGHTTAGMHTR